MTVEETTAGSKSDPHNDDGAAEHAADKSGQGVVIAFGKTMKTLRVRAGLDREEFGRRLGYSASTSRRSSRAAGSHHPGRSTARTRNWARTAC